MAEQMAPRGLNRKEAAAYLGISPDLFDRGIFAGVLPQPRKLFEKRIWDLRELDRALDDLPHFTVDERRRGDPSNDNPDQPLSERERWLANQK